MRLKGIMLTVMLFACGGDAGAGGDAIDAGNDGALTLRPSESQLYAVPGGGTSLTVDVVREGVAGPVALEVVGLPAGVAAEFDESPTSGESVGLRLTVAQEALAGLHGLYIVGHIGDGVAGGVALSLRVAQGSHVHLRGRVVDMYAQPLSQAAVQVGDATTTTDASGHFEIPGLVAPPYDVAVKQGDGIFHVYRGLSIPNPVLELASFTLPGGLASATLEASLSGGAGPDAQNAQVMAFAGADAWGASAPGAMQVHWPSEGEGNGELFGLEFARDLGQQPTTYTGFGKRSVMLDDGDSVAVNILLQPVGTSWIAGDITVAPVHHIAERVLWLQLGPHTAVPLASSVAADASFTWAVPDLAYPVGVQVRARSGTRESYRYVADIKPGEVISLDVPAAPTIVSPINSGIDGIPRHVTFAWSGDPAAIHAVAIAAPGLTVIVYTERSDTSFPEAQAIGLAWPAKAKITWYVTAIGPWDGIDAYVTEGGGIGFFGLGRDVTLAYSDLAAVFLAP